MNMNLSKKVSLFSIIVIFLVSIGMGLISVKISTDRMVNQVNESLLELANEAGNHIRDLIDGDLNTLLQISNRLTIDNISWEEQRELLISDMEKLKYEDMFIVNKEGLGRSILDDEIVDLSNNLYFKKALLGENNVSDVLVDEETKKTQIAYAVPIKDGKEIIGALIGYKDGFLLSNITDNLGFGENGYGYIIGTDTTFYAHPNRDMVIEQRNLRKDMDTDEELKDVALAFEELGIGSKGTINYEYLGERRYMGVVPMTSTGWIIAVGAYESDILAGVNTLRKAMYIYTLGFMVLGAVLALMLGKRFSNPIIEVSRVLNTFSNYNLYINKDEKILKLKDRKDEIGIITRSLISMKDNLIKLIENIFNTSHIVAASSEELTAITQQSSIVSEEIAKTIGQIAAGANEQAEDIKYGLIHLEKLGKKIEQNYKEIHDLNSESDEIKVLKDEGLNIIEELVEKTEISNESIMEIKNIILDTSESVEKIENASDMIKNISEQTNLLALNAAIEAARSGEAGKGFSVVAEEIRKLAEESSRFTEEIKSIMAELIGKVKNAISTIEEVILIIKDQSKSVDLTSSKFQGIAESIEKMKKLMVSISETSEYIENEKEEVINTIQNISLISQENAAATEEASASIEEQSASVQEIARSAESLSSLADEMQQLINKFKH